MQRQGLPLQSTVNSQSSARFDPLEQVTGLILAGGRGRRWGGQDKGLIEIAGKTMVEHVLERVRPQVATIIISANRNLDSYRGFGCPVIEDTDGDFDGPLAGIAAGLAAAKTEWVTVVPCDSPLVPQDLVARLVAAVADDPHRIAIAYDGEREQQLFGLLHRSRLSALEDYLASGERSAARWFASQGPALVDFSDCPENFRNINRPDDRAEIEALLARQQA